MQPNGCKDESDNSFLKFFILRLLSAKAVKMETRSVIFIKQNSNSIIQILFFVFIIFPSMKINI